MLTVVEDDREDRNNPSGWALEDYRWSMGNVRNEYIQIVVTTNSIYLDSYDKITIFLDFDREIPISRVFYSAHSDLWGWFIQHCH